MHQRIGIPIIAPDQNTSLQVEPYALGSHSAAAPYAVAIDGICMLQTHPPTEQ